MADTFTAANLDEFDKAEGQQPTSNIAGDGKAIFDEDIYLRINPDVRQAVTAGVFPSGREHFERYGKAEGRPTKLHNAASRNRVLFTGTPASPRENAKPQPSNIDAIRLSKSGGIFIAGWSADDTDGLESVDLYFGGWSVSFEAASLARVRRGDVETVLNRSDHPFGFWGFMFAGQSLPGGHGSALIRLKSGAETCLAINLEPVSDFDLRKTALGYLAGSAFFGNHQFEAAAAIDHSIGRQLVDFNKVISRAAVRSPYVEVFGKAGRRYRGSIIVCLYGRPEYMFLQNAIFSAQAGMPDHEIIYVCNSPEIGEQLLREARLCRHIYGLDQTVIILNGNGGFGAANNLAASYARSDRLLILNPDVFPRDADAIEKHTKLVEALPAAQTALFGVPLYYDDGSLMHGGMYFDSDIMPKFGKAGATAARLLRVEHFGKGAPPDSARFLASRPVAAITGAFMSAEKTWFEKLGGFNEEYIFGHYEDADLCLKSIRHGRLPWLHDIKFWHLEGKGSTRLHEHEGGSLANRWLFTRTWADLIISNPMFGPAGIPAPHAGPKAAPDALKKRAARA